MPRFPKGFGRRKSTANALEDLPSPAAESSFKVLERPNQNHNKNSSFDGGIKLTRHPERPSTSPMHRGEDNMFAGLNRDRDSGGSHSNTTSTFTTDNSSRFSAASTTPSTHNSGEYHRQDERVSHPDRTYDIPAPKLPRASSAFSVKAGGRTFSFGRGKGTPPLVREEFLPPPPPIIVDYENMGAGRSRGASHASTTTPPKLEDQDLGLNLGGTFSSDMFSNFKQKSTLRPSEGNNQAMSRTTEPEVVEPAKPLPAYSSNRAHHPPPPLTIDRSRNIEPSPYSWASHDSGRGLMAATPSPPPVAYMNDAPPVPPHGGQYESNGDNFASHARPQRPGGPIDSGLRRSSAFSGKRRSTFEIQDTVDEDAKLLRESYHASRQLSNDSQSKENDENGRHRPNSPDATPRQQMHHVPSVSSDHESEVEDIFDPSIAEHAILANQLSEQVASPPRQRPMPRHKIMTPAQFERAKQDHERAVISGTASSSKDDDEEDNYDEDEDEQERLKNIAKQRKLQDAHLAVFRQGMMKSTGETPSPLTNRPNIMSSYSTPNLTLGGKSIEDDSDEDEEVPLAILAAHGFPNKNRHPNQLPGMNSNPLISHTAPPSSHNGSAIGAGGGGNLPIFARNLPQDPYFGASVVNPLNRDPLTFGSRAGSSHGGGYQGQGLVGVIAEEERNRAMRRGSPNPAGSFGAKMQFGPTGMQPHQMNMHPHPQMAQQPMMNPMAMPPMMANPMMMNPMMPMPQMGMTQDQIDFMRMQMQMMQMSMMNGSGVPPPGSVNGGGPPQQQQQRTSTMTGSGAPTLQIPGIGPSNPSQRPASSAGRTMSLIDPNTAPWRNTMPHYTPSIAPSERSNVGLSARYRPVTNPTTNAENINNGSGLRQSTWSNGGTTVKANQRVEREEEEDEEKGWLEMKRKREEKRGFWREKRGDEEIRGILGGLEGL